MDDDQPTVEMPAVNDGDDDNDGIVNALVFDRMYLGELAEVPRVRAGLHEWLNGSPVSDDCELIITELASNAVQHSVSRGLYFSARAYRFSDHIRLEVEDLGGPWRPKPVDGRPHGLDLVALLSEDWGTEVRTCDGLRTTWAQVPITQTPKVSDEATAAQARTKKEEVPQSA